MDDALRAGPFPVGLRRCCQARAARPGKQPPDNNKSARRALSLGSSKRSVRAHSELCVIRAKSSPLHGPASPAQPLPLSQIETLPFYFPNNINNPPSFADATVLVRTGLVTVIGPLSADVTCVLGRPCEVFVTGPLLDANPGMMKLVQGGLDCGLPLVTGEG
jgi:hypothetical protein